MTRLTTLNLAPFYKNTVGLNHLFDQTLNRVEHANGSNYPPYNIISVSEDKYRVEIAIAGFGQDDITVTSQDGQLVVDGDSRIATSIEEPETVKVNYLHHGISNKTFRRTFQLADYVEIQSAEVSNGILVIELERIVPDSLKPKQIEVKFAS